MFVFMSPLWCVCMYVYMWALNSMMWITHPAEHRWTLQKWTNYLLCQARGMCKWGNCMYVLSAKVDAHCAGACMATQSSILACQVFCVCIICVCSFDSLHLSPLSLSLSLSPSFTLDMLTDKSSCQCQIWRWAWTTHYRMDMNMKPGWTETDQHGY